MARFSTTIYLKCLIICMSVFSLVVSLNVNQGNPKPRITKFSSTKEPASESQMAVSTTTKGNLDVAIYRLSKAGTTCILLKTDALVEIKFKLHELDENVSTFIPNNPSVEGTCNEDSSFMRISWTGYSLVIYFLKTPGGDRWYIDHLKLTVDSDLRLFQGIQKTGKYFKLYHKDTLIAAPVGRSFSCDELQVDLQTDKEDNPPPGMQGTLDLRLLQVQPFMYKGDNFDTPFECKSQLSFRDETAPIAVGSTLAIAVLVTITGYGIYRYFKVKNVQYNTME